jgi:RNA polymerase sigma-70 factor, ECF subfamily
LDRHERFETEAMPHLRALYGTAYRMTRNAHDAEDLVQETFLRAFRAFDGYEPGTNAKAWLYTILFRVRTDSFRRAGRSPKLVELEGEGPVVAPTQERDLVSSQGVAQALEKLPEAFRAAIVLRDLEDFSYDEIARILDVPIGTVMSRIHRGRALLRAALGEPA